MGELITWQDEDLLSNLQRLIHGQCLVYPVKSDMRLHIPAEVLFHIFLWLNADSLDVAGIVSRRWQSAVRKNRPKLAKRLLREASVYESNGTISGIIVNCDNRKRLVRGSPNQ